MTPVFRVLILVSSPWSSSEEPASSPAWCTNGWSVLRPTADPRWWLGLRPSAWRPGWTLRATSHKRTDKVSLSKLSSDHLFYKPTLCFLCRDFGEERHLRHRHEGETQQLQEHSDDKGCQLPFITTWQWWKQPKFYRIPIKLPLKNKKKKQGFNRFPLYGIGQLWYFSDWRIIISLIQLLLWCSFEVVSRKCLGISTDSSICKWNHSQSGSQYIFVLRCFASCTCWCDFVPTWIRKSVVLTHTHKKPHILLYLQCSLFRLKILGLFGHENKEEKKTSTYFYL